MILIRDYIDCDRSATEVVVVRPPGTPPLSFRVDPPLSGARDPLEVLCLTHVLHPNNASIILVI